MTSEPRQKENFFFWSFDFRVIHCFSCPTHAAHPAALRHARCPRLRLACGRHRWCDAGPVVAGPARVFRNPSARLHKARGSRVRDFDVFASRAARGERSLRGGVSFRQRGRRRDRGGAWWRCRDVGGTVVEQATSVEPGVDAQRRPRKRGATQRVSSFLEAIRRRRCRTRPRRRRRTRRFCREPRPDRRCPNVALIWSAVAK